MFFPKWALKAITTWFGCGYVPIAPGTAGSIGALPLCYLFATIEILPLRILCAIGITAIAILASAQDQMTGQQKDPSYIVIDEVAGMTWSTLLLAPFPLEGSIPKTWVLAFVLFRFFDVLKPYPARFFDQRSKISPHGFLRGAHIVLDDVIAGIYTMLILWILHLEWARQYLA